MPRQKSNTINELLLFSCQAVSNSSRLHRPQNFRPLCPSLSPGVFSSSCPLHWWCHPAISYSDTLFSFCPQSFPAWGTFPISQLFASDDQNSGVSASASVFPVSIQGWLLLRLTGLISGKWDCVIYKWQVRPLRMMFINPPAHELERMKWSFSVE